MSYRLSNNLWSVVHSLDKHLGPPPQKKLGPPPFGPPKKNLGPPPQNRSPGGPKIPEKVGGGHKNNTYVLDTVIRSHQMKSHILIGSDITVKSYPVI